MQQLQMFYSCWKHISQSMSDVTDSQNPFLCFSDWDGSVQIPFEMTFWKWFQSVRQKSDFIWFVTIQTRDEPTGLNLDGLKIGF